MSKADARPCRSEAYGIKWTERQIKLTFSVAVIAIKAKEGFWLHNKRTFSP